MNLRSTMKRILAEKLKLALMIGRVDDPPAALFCSPSARLPGADFRSVSLRIWQSLSV
jgi:hypothetical protein